MAGAGLLNTEDFSRARRIVKTDDFSSVFRLRPAQKSMHFVLYARPNQLPHARLGVVVAKRLAPRAVTRNAIKRMTREIFRRGHWRSVDLIVRLSASVNSRQGPARTNALTRSLAIELKNLLTGQLANVFVTPD